jgi:lysophospholipase L1-like esterase
LEVFVNILRQRHPATPIFLVENLEYPDGIIIPARKMSYEKANQTLHEIYTRLSRTDGNLHYFPGRNLIGTDGEATVDGVHPTDLGAMRMADQMEPALRQALAD